MLNSQKQECHREAKAARKPRSPFWILGLHFLHLWLVATSRLLL